ncbi:Guanine nucleotide exchange factor VAV3 [Pteropus alecto]|uniref:Guanine nucleotide exchange factor VAV3 n=1 Tax=Pteropus alecto TaxID=9402 RepID=L5K3B7_PTEAL|nr:Guanine nucleotide exchange factor VAV3 [Pteropus alecto]
MEPWKQCAQWLIHCKVLPANHRVTWDSAQVFDLAQTLRDGVLLCQLLNNLRARSINLKEINLRPQMSQFLCLKNIRTFLTACCETFGMRKSELFEAFDLFDVRDFGKVIETLSRLSRTPIALATGIRPFPTEESVNDEDIYKGLPDLIDETHVEDEEGLYDCVYGEDEGGEVYEDLMKAEEAHQPELVKVHRNLMQEIHDSIVNKNDQNLYQIFINYKERLVIYGQYCSGVESAISSLDYISKTKEDVKLKLEECSKRANNGKFTLRDLLVVPMQRVLKYHLLLQIAEKRDCKSEAYSNGAFEKDLNQGSGSKDFKGKDQSEYHHNVVRGESGELVKHTADPVEKANLKLALDAMKDLAQYVNEVKRDNETLREIKQFQLSIENLNQPVLLFGRPQGDGEIRITTLDKHTKQERHIFLFDLAVIVCKRKGDNYEMKEIIDLQQYKIANNPTTDKENKKWSYGFYLIHTQGQNGLEFYCKTKDLKKKWLEQFEMAL